MPRVVVVGAGVSGLTTALVLARTGQYTVTIVAEHMPGDYSINYASPWAGANVLPYSTPGTPNNRYEAATWPVLAQFAKDLPEAGVHFQDAYEYVRARDSDTPVGLWVAELVKKDPWFKDLMPNFRNLTKDQVPQGYDGGSAFTSVCINTALYLPWLASQCLKHGAKIKRGIVTHITQATKLSHDGQPADLIVNCTGLSSLHLGGVEDKTLYPGRGQIVIVSNDPGIMAGTTGTDDYPEEMTYIMHRAAGGGTVIGGCLQANKWESQPDPNMAVRIMQRAVEVCPSLVPPGKGIEGLQVIRHSVGLRPMRKDGIRVECEAIPAPEGQKVVVVHNYGHGGYGYQTSWGAAEEAVKLVGASLKSKARL